MIPAALHQRVLARIERDYAVAEAHFNRKFPRPTVVYSKATRNAGRAFYHENKIELSALLLLDPKNQEEMVNTTCPHESAHLLTGIIYPETKEAGPIQFTRRGIKRGKTSPHGPEWKSIMRILGVDESRCHDMELSEDAPIAGRERIRHDWKCIKCGNIIQLGPKHNKALLMGQPVYHKQCGRMGKLIKPDAPMPWQLQAADMLQRPVAPLPAAPAPAPVQPYRAITPAPMLPPAKPAPAQQSYGSKMDHCKALYKMNVNMSRAFIIAEFVAKAGCTSAGAATYYATCKKLFG